MNQYQDDYKRTIQLLKQSIIESRYQAAKLVNEHLLHLYHFIGGIISQKAIEANWGDKILETISDDLQKEMPGLRGFSSQNLKKMRIFFEAYHDKIGSALTNQNDNKQIGSALMNQIHKEFWNIGFTHHYLIVSKTKSLDERKFYINETSKNAWSSRILEYHLKSDLYHQQGKLPSNFTDTLPSVDQALSQFKDEYLLDFINVEESDDERILENEIVLNIKNFLMSLGTGFTFIGNQHRLIVDGDEFLVDLLFYNRKIQALVAIELKRGKFKPEYVGQLNFYLNVLDDQVKLPQENQTIGIILCKEKSNTVVEYALGNINKPMGVATFKTASELPETYRGVMPETEDLKKLLK